MSSEKTSVEAWTENNSKSTIPRKDTKNGRLEPGTTEDGDNRDKLKKNITLTRGVALVVGTIIGTGIFITPNSISASVKAPATSIMVWFAGGVVAAIGGLTFNELGTMIPLSGAEVTFLKHIYGPLPSFLSVWLLHFLLSGMRRAIAVLGFSKYFWALFYDADVDPVPWYLDKIVCLVVLVLMISLIAFKPTLALRFIVVWTSLKFLAVIVIIVAGFAYLFKGHTENISAGFNGTNLDLKDWGDAWNGVIWSYLGWEQICIVISEVQNPQKNIPLIVGISVSIVTILYILTVTSFHIVIPYNVMADSDVAVAAVFGNTTMGKAGEIILSIAVMLSTLGSLQCTLLTQSRYIHSGAVEGILPRVFSLVSKTYKTPIVSVLYLGIITAIFVLIGDVEALIGSASFTVFPFYVACAIGVFVMRYKFPDLHRPYRCPLIMPAIFTIFGIYVFITPFFGPSWLTNLVWVCVVLLGIPIYFVLVKDIFRLTFISDWMESLKNFVGKKLNCD